MTEPPIDETGYKGAEEVRKPVAYVSAPGYNNPQRVCSEKIITILEDAGYEVSLPTISAEIPEKEEAQACLSALQNADVVIAWLDGLSAEGISIYTVAGVQTKLEITLPPKIIEMMQAGAILMQKQGVNFQKKKGRALVLPHEMNNPPEVPNQIVMDLEKQGAKALCALNGQPMNLPDPSTTFEVGYAFAARKPVIALALIEPEIGMYLGWTPNVVTNSLEGLARVMVKYQPHAVGDYKVQVKKLEEIQGTDGYDLHEAWRERLPKGGGEDPMDMSDIIPKEEGEKKDASEPTPKA